MSNVTGRTRISHRRAGRSLSGLRQTRTLPIGRALGVFHWPTEYSHGIPSSELIHVSRAKNFSLSLSDLSTNLLLLLLLRLADISLLPFLSLVLNRHDMEFVKIDDSIASRCERRKEFVMYREETSSRRKTSILWATDSDWRCEWCESNPFDRLPRRLTCGRRCDDLEEEEVSESSSQC